MVKILLIAAAAVLPAMMSMPLLAQSDLIELNKDPFRQPDMLKYRPPAPAARQNLERDAGGIPQLKLTATLISVSEPMVIVNDTLLQVGDEIEGMRLILIDEGRAIFRYAGKNHEFTLDEPATEAQAESEE